MLNTTS